MIATIVILSACMLVMAAKLWRDRKRVSWEEHEHVLREMRGLGQSCDDLLSHGNKLAAEVAQWEARHNLLLSELTNIRLQQAPPAVVFANGLTPEQMADLEAKIKSSRGIHGGRLSVVDLDLECDLPDSWDGPLYELEK